MSLYIEQQRQRRPVFKVVSFISLTGTEAPGIGLQEERSQPTEASEGSGSCVVYNPYVSLSIEQQRQRLPVFKVCRYAGYWCRSASFKILLFTSQIDFRKRLLGKKKKLLY